MGENTYSRTTEGVMRQLLAITCLCLLPCTTGCSLLPAALFGIFGDHYSGGGYTRADREDHFNRAVEASQNHRDY